MVLKIDTTISAHVTVRAREVRLRSAAAAMNAALSSACSCQPSGSATSGATKAIAIRYADRRIRDTLGATGRIPDEGDMGLRRRAGAQQTAARPHQRTRMTVARSVRNQTRLVRRPGHIDR